VTQNTSSRKGDEAAAQRLNEAFAPETIDALLKDAKSSGTPIDGVDGLLNQLGAALLEGCRDDV
jgi:putative transposase